MTARPTAQADNLFAAAKSYTLAAMRLQGDLEDHPALLIPFAMLAGFAFELSCKAAMVASGARAKDLKRIGHDLRMALQAAESCGYRMPTDKGVAQVIEVLADGHKSLLYRYVPDVEIVDLPEPNRLVVALSAHVTAIEKQFPVWSNTREPPGPEKDSPRAI